MYNKLFCIFLQTSLRGAAEIFPLTNAGLLPFVEKRKGSFFSGRKQKMEKGKGGLGSEWFHIPPWEVPNFRASFEVGMKRALGGWRSKSRGT